ncbi:MULTISPECIES: hypothetical protein [Cupriavidus]|uniref:Lipoprotein n=2 Tax=Cupriavidus TaxID=106589 RepID=A0A1U9URK8_CUPNE|nr:MULTISPECIES: hypothetical protein [Cupriavidus]AQV95324.1 hypothetical protein BJN34_15705 [Cupriavidus necator]RDK12162.1 hypothetical protein DN412_01035 [Cupriavidus lacunae]
MSRLRTIALLSLCAAMLAACSEKPQTIGASHRKSDAPAYQGAPDDPFVVKGWTPGDKTSWENQIHQRNQNQNEYNRTQ